MLRVSGDGHAVPHPALLQTPEADLLQVRAVNHARVGQSVPLSEVLDRVEDCVPRVADAVLDAACASACKRKQADIE